MLIAAVLLLLLLLLFAELIFRCPVRDPRNLLRQEVRLLCCLNILERGTGLAEMIRKTQCVLEQQDVVKITINNVPLSEALL